MKLGKAVLFASVFAAMSSAQAAVNVEFATGVESMFVNGEKKLNLLESTENVTLGNGFNQVVVRVSKLIEGQGQLEKYRSVPIVMTFEASDQTVLIEPTMRLLNSVDKSNFDANPSMKLVTKNGSAVKAKIDVLPKNMTGDTSTLVGRNYQNELTTYNRSQGYAIAAAAKVAPAPEPKTFQIIGAGSADTQTAVAVQQPVPSGNNAMILMQADFLRLSDAQRLSFLKWANQQ
ncbi:DUF2057 domain-containing protein [Photobacterium japonica]|uniref:DUF2057 family protein n=1 Tax=Photobacterium japonica TaxID=2910235 RepID=UPI003D14ED32